MIEAYEMRGSPFLGISFILQFVYRGSLTQLRLKLDLLSRLQVNGSSDFFLDTHRHAELISAHNVVTMSPC